MTQEEKFKEAQRLYETANADQRYVLESLFPELKESEDERIRKEITEFFNNFSKTGTWNAIPDVTKWLAWLEKQGEKEYDWSEESYDDARLNDIVSKVENDLQLNKAEINWLKSIKEKLHEEIHYWTEEEIEPIISDYLRGTEHYGGMIGRLRCLKPKSLERQGEQEAWSEEDEENLNWFEKFFRAESVIAGGKDIPQDRYLWFKSLKDRVQPQWKPSDEQMKSLEESIMFFGTSWVSTRQFALESLYQDLKKLKG